MTSATSVQTLNIGDTVPVGSALVNMIIMAIITDVNNPNMFAATLQAYQSNALLTIPALQGIAGPPGQPTYALRFQNDTLESPSQLPQDLTDLPADLGKYWVFGVTDENANVIATVSYVWYGADIGYREFPIGTPGPPGPFPIITPHIVLEEPGNGQGPGGADSWIVVTGTISNPSFTFHIAAPQGVPGPVATLGTSADVDFTTNAPLPGDILTCSARLTPGSPSPLLINVSTTGGAFAAGNHFWTVTAVLGNGDETMPSNEVIAQLTGSTSSVTLTWNIPAGAGAVGFKIYRGTSATDLSVLVTEIFDGTVNTYTDTGGAGTPGQPPSAAVVAGRPIWVPVSPIAVLPKLYTVPASAFQSIAGIGGATQTVCTFAVPQQPWPWKPFIMGQMKIFGLSISFSPLLVGAQIRLGDVSSGTIIAAGTGNDLGSVTLIPMASTSANQSQAMTPTNGVGLVPANHTGTAGTLYTSLVQQGMAGVYDYNPANSQLAIVVVPCPLAVAGS